MMRIDEIIKAISMLGFKQFYSSKLNSEFEFWDYEKIEEYNLMYNVQKFIPGYLGIGSNGAGEILTIDLSSGAVYAIPFIPMDISERIEVSSSIKDLK